MKMDDLLKQRFAQACERNIRKATDHLEDLTDASDDDIKTIFEATVEEVEGMSWNYEKHAEEIFEIVYQGWLGLPQYRRWLKENT